MFNIAFICLSSQGVFITKDINAQDVRLSLTKSVSQEFRFGVRKLRVEFVALNDAPILVHSLRLASFQFNPI